jgi:two-component system sensor histidine kinase/response regulator
MTADALDADRTRVLEAGMNDRIVKPLAVGPMFATIARWIRPAAGRVKVVRQTPASGVSAATLPADAPLPPMPGIDVAAGLAVAVGNPLLYRRLLQRFLEGNTAFDARVTAAIAARDFGTAEREAHTLTGTAGSIGAGAVAAAARVLERACQSRDRSAIDAARPALTRALDVVLRVIVEARPQLDVPQRASVPVDGVRARALVRRLGVELEAADPRATASARELVDVLQGTTVAAAAVAVRRQCEEYAYDLALAALAVVRDAMPSNDTNGGVP